jgi:hypothetical protein
VLLLCRILCWLFPRTLTALRRITMMLTEVWVGFVWVCTCTNKVHTFHPKSVPSTYYFPRVRTWYILVCTVFTKILQWMLFYVACLWETILCMRDIYAAVLWYWIVPLLVSNIDDIILVCRAEAHRVQSMVKINFGLVTFFNNFNDFQMFVT